LKYNKRKNIKGKNEDKNGIKIRGVIYNDNSRFIPRIEIKLNNEDKYEIDII
jgi:hypothetical protein